MAGGKDETSAEFLDLNTLTWESKQSLPYDIDLAACVPYKDSFLMVGGYSSDRDDFQRTIYYYDPTEEGWDLLVERMEFPGDRFAGFLVPDSFANCN